jgi:voltage-gated potassium channel Kch
MQLIHAYIRLLRAIYEAFTHQLVLALFSVNLLLVSLSSVIYVHLEGWDFTDALYFSVITISTVGYGDLTPVTAAGKLFTSGYIFVGTGFFFLAVGAFAEDVIKYIREHR